MSTNNVTGHSAVLVRQEPWSGFASPDEVVESLPFNPSIRAYDWPLGIRAERYYRLPGHELTVPAESHVRVSLQMRHTGRIHFAWGGKTCELAKGQFKLPLVTVTPIGVPQQWDWTGPCESFHLILPGHLFERAATESGIGWNHFALRPDTGTPHPQLIGLLQCLERSLRQPEISCLMQIRHLCQALACRLLQTHGYQRQLKTIRVQRQLLSEAVRRKVVDLMRARMAGKVTIEELAHTANIVPDHFTRLFRETFGVTPSRRLRQLRVERAVELLGRPTTGDPLTSEQVAQAAGFAHGSHLAKALRAERGQSIADARGS